MAGVWREQVYKRITRSRQWSRVRKEHLKEHPTCANCGKRKIGRMQVHHIYPFHIYPEYELFPANLLTLCDNPRCHLDKGHLGYWKSWNKDVLEDVEIWLEKYTNRP